MIRRYHRWALWLPRHMPRLHPAHLDPLVLAAQPPQTPQAQ
jgi:hypothetical protein